MSLEEIPQKALTAYDDALEAIRRSDLPGAVDLGQAALRTAQETEPRPRFFITRCQCLLSNVLGRLGRYKEAGEYAQEAIFVCSLLPMDEEVFDVWAKSVIYRSAALCGLGDHLSAIESLKSGKHQVRGFPGMTALADRVFDDQLSLLRQRFGIDEE